MAPTPVSEPLLPRTRAGAQRRADRIRAFREELDAASRDDAVELTPQQRSQLQAYHEGLLEQLSRRFDIDTSERHKQISRGMQVVSLLGAVALGASVLLYFVRVWGLLSTPVQVAVLASAPFLSMAALELVSRRERLRFMTGLLAAMTFASVVLNVEGLARIFAVVPSPEGLLAYGLVALALAYAHGQRLLLAAGVVCLSGYAAAAAVRAAGWWWTEALHRPETLLGAGALAVAGSLLPHRTRDDFPPVLRAAGFVEVFLAILVMSRLGEGSWMAAEPRRVELAYQVVSFVAAGWAIWLGLRRGWLEVTTLGTVFFAVFLFVKFFDWWWDWMPRYLFFLAIGLTSLALLWAFTRVRARLAGP